MTNTPPSSAPFTRASEVLPLASPTSAGLAVTMLPIGHPPGATVTAPLPATTGGQMLVVVTPDIQQRLGDLRSQEGSGCGGTATTGTVSSQDAHMIDAEQHPVLVITTRGMSEVHDGPSMIRDQEELPVPELQGPSGLSSAKMPFRQTEAAQWG